MEQIKAPELYCRTMWCPRCHARGSPKVKDLFALYGRNSKQLIVYRSIYRTSGKNTGYTPHLIRYLDGNFKFVSFEAMCLIHKCGVLITPDENENVWIVKHIHKKIFSVPVNDWEELLKYKDDDYYLDIT